MKEPNYINSNEIELVRYNTPANLSVKEAATYLTLSERKLRDMLAKHEIKHVRLGSRIILRRIDLDSYMEDLVA